ncbi:hypothetical protein WJX81_005297 [Elliptochloris bilobata]|uniref:Uncharacterized protein n=1 Tax=Elliptochloris bilobata TaxID=381761 RepID=A0AAW1S955_9CHLO
MLRGLTHKARAWFDRANAAHAQHSDAPPESPGSSRAAKRKADGGDQDGDSKRPSTKQTEPEGQAIGSDADAPSGDAAQMRASSFGAGAAFGQQQAQAPPGLAHAGSIGAAGFTMGGGDQQKAARRMVRAKRPGRR